MSHTVTRSGGRIQLAPTIDVSELLIEDVAWSLAHTVRFNGHVSMPHSTAEHSVKVSYMVAPEHAYAALLHDAHEAILGDIPAPFKTLPLFAGAVQFENMLQWHVLKHFGVNLPKGLPDEVHAADRLAARLEMAQYMPGPTRERLWDDWCWKDYEERPKTYAPLTARQAYDYFLDRYYKLRRDSGL